MGSLGSKQKGNSSMVNYQAAVQGLSGAGKSAICYRLRSVDFIPMSKDFTKDFQEHVFSYGGRMPLYHSINLKVKKTTYEFGLWEYILDAVKLSSIVFCVDSSDRSRIDEARVSLEVMLLRSDLKQLPLLIYANKQDLEGCMSPREVEDVLQLANIKDRPYHVEGCSAASGEGLWEGLEWLAKQHHGGKKTEYIEKPVNETLEDGKAMLKSGHSWISSLFVRKAVK